MSVWGQVVCDLCRHSGSNWKALAWSSKTWADSGRKGSDFGHRFGQWGSLESPTLSARLGAEFGQTWGKCCKARPSFARHRPNDGRIRPHLAFCSTSGRCRQDIGAEWGQSWGNLGRHTHTCFDIGQSLANFGRPGRTRPALMDQTRRLDLGTLMEQRSI